MPDVTLSEKAGAVAETPFKSDMADGTRAGLESGQVLEEGKKVSFVVGNFITEGSENFCLQISARCYILL